MGKIIFLDIDGTIRDFDGYIPKSAIQAINQARKNGHKVCISTGRPYCQIEDRVKAIGFDGIVSGCGSYVEYEEKCVHHKCFESNYYKELYKYLMKHNCTIELQTYKECYLPEECIDSFNEIGKKIQQKLGKKSIKLANPPKISKNCEDIEKIEKMLFFSNELSNEKLIEEWGQYLYVVPMSIPNSEKWGGEITPIIVNKAEGIKSILKFGNYDKSDLIAIGDSENDIDMLNLASIGVVMGNGNKKAKDNADIITDTLRNDGLSHAFEKLKLI